MKETLSAFIFINPEQALRFGHIAWGFEVAPAEYFWGSTDHLLKRPYWDVIALARNTPTSYPAKMSTTGVGPVAPSSKCSSDMATGPHIRYHSFKELAVAGLPRPLPRPRVFAESKLLKAAAGPYWPIIACTRPTVYWRLMGQPAHSFRILSGLHIRP